MTATMIQACRGLLLLGSCFLPLALASPTPNEFEACHRMASALLRACLDNSAGQASERCWERARLKNKVCSAEVRQRHRPDRERTEAAKRAAAK
ncbi:MAG: hypothetical protein Q7K57_02325, partial [Burkholderiaceae bacterium]|nr:hypothetical protein [Burkholderiaceae bacterium]